MIVNNIARTKLQHNHQHKHTNVPFEEEESGSKTMMSIKSNNSTSMKNYLMFVNNDDWEVTKDVYASSIVQDGIIDIGISLNGMVGIRRASLRTITAEASKEALSKDRAKLAASSVMSEDNLTVYEYCILSEIFQPPVIRLTFHYKKNMDNEGTSTSEKYNDDDGDDDNHYYNEVELDSVDIEIHSMSQELLASWPTKTNQIETQTKTTTSTSSSNINDTSNKEEMWLEWLEENIKTILNETKKSFSICVFIEHQALSYFDSLDKDERFQYIAISLQASKYESQYESEYEHDSTITHIDDYVPWDETKWLHSKLYSTKYNTDTVKSNKDPATSEQKQQQQQQQQQSLSTTIDQFAIQIIQQQWKSWIAYTCPICYDTICYKDDGIELPCRHILCTTCTEMYIQSKFSELHLNRRKLPFICPITSCKQSMKIRQYFGPFISEKNRKILDEWKLNLQHPKATTLTICPRKACKSTDMRYGTNKPNETMVFCNTCSKGFCEACLNIYDGIGWRQYSKHTEHQCEKDTVMKLYVLYTHASKEEKCKADAKWHWLKDFTLSIDLLTDAWILNNGTRCPTCKVGIERISGCNHMRCSQCGTHFCYVCCEEECVCYSRRRRFDNL